MSRKPNIEKQKLGDISKHASTSSGAAAYAKRTGIRRAAFHAVPAAFEIMLPPTLRRRSANIQAELVFSIGSEASYTHASEAHSRN